MNSPERRKVNNELYSSKPLEASTDEADEGAKTCKLVAATGQNKA